MKLSNPFNHLADGIIANVAQKFLSSLLKSAIAVAIAALTALQNTDIQSALSEAGAENALVLKGWALVLPFIVAAVSALKRAATFDPAKVK